MEAQEACTSVMRHPDYVGSILRAFKAMQLHIDGVLCHCGRVCKTWHATVGQMQHNSVWFLSYVRNTELWVVQAPLQMQAMHASSIEAYANTGGFRALLPFSMGFSLDLANLKQQYEGVVHSMVQGMTQNALHKNAQVVGMCQLHKLCQLILLSDAFCFTPSQC